MKKVFTILAAILLTASVFAQAPQKMSYQAVIRDVTNNLVTNQAVGMRVSILQGSGTGTEVFKEIYNPNPQTNANGLITIEIGGGIPLVGTFATIDWASGPYFIKTETDPTGGTNYTIAGTSQLMSVPYALFSANGGIQGATGATGNTGSCGYSIGQNVPVLGGYIFYLDPTGCHGLVCPTTDQSTGIQWYNGSYTTTNAVRDGIGAGMYNTERIIANQGTGSYAAQLCANYQGGGYGDWYLPSKYELNLLYLQKDVVGGFADDLYWSSTELGSIDAWLQDFVNGDQFSGVSKNATYYVRAVRAF